MIFNPPERQYFRVESGPCYDALVVWRKRREEVQALCFDYAKSVGGTGFYAGSDDSVGNAVAINAITFSGDLPKGWKPRRWKSFVVKEGATPAWPDQRTTVGRDSLKAIKKLPLAPSSNQVCDAIGFPHTVRYSGKETITGSSGLGLWETLRAGWNGDTFYVGLPKLDEEIDRLEAKGYTVETPRWKPLPGMVPILKEEMDLDFARAKLREKEAA